MNRRLLLGIDAGTTGLKAVLSDADGTPLPRPTRNTRSTTRTPMGRANPTWWRACCDVLPCLLQQAGARPGMSQALA